MPHKRSCWLLPCWLWVSSVCRAVVCAVSQQLASQHVRIHLLLPQALLPSLLKAKCPQHRYWCFVVGSQGVLQATSAHGCAKRANKNREINDCHVDPRNAQRITSSSHATQIEIYPASSAKVTSFIWPNLFFMSTTASAPVSASLAQTRPHPPGRSAASWCLEET